MILNISTQDSVALAMLQTESSGSISVWFWISMAELIIILLLLLCLLGKPRSMSEKDHAKAEVLENDKPDFGNTMNSMWKAQGLYNELKKKCHPDRFPSDPQKNQIANELAQSIGENKHNYEKLVELKKIAEQKLNINF